MVAGICFSTKFYSRSQCIINIRRGSEQSGEEFDGNTSNNTILTIVDLAGAEREKKTGNQVLACIELYLPLV